MKKEKQQEFHCMCACGKPVTPEDKKRMNEQLAQYLEENGHPELAKALRHVSPTNS